MYLHPLIHAAFIRHRQQELTLRKSRARLGVEQASLSRLGKQTGKIGLLIIATITILALTATSSYAATSKKAPNRRNAPKDATWRVVQLANGTVIVRIGRRIIYTYYPAPSQLQVSSSTSSDDCAYYQVNCSDEENCQLWGVNCDLVNNTSNDTRTADQNSASSESSNDGSGQADNTNLEPLPEVVSDSSAIQTANDTAVNLAAPSQDEDC